ncbi:MAG TPA: nuclease domain-containing protein [Burkholderiales bacterium]|nr:nuclease domain-containing protein [Burkholderiales bacterium]
MIERGMYRDRKLLDLCHYAPCFLQIPGVCQNGVNPSVPCHSNFQRHGRGHSHKSHDIYTVPGCGPCHDWLDKGPASRQEKDEAFMHAWERWMLHMFRYAFVSVRQAQR